MKKVCAWCEIVMSGESERDDETNPITHGICDSCFTQAWNDIGIPLELFLDSIPIPTLLVDGDLVVEGANQGILGMLGKPLEELAGRWSGEVFECVNSTLPEGCGRTIHCSGCVLRGEVTRTYETGESRTRIPAQLKVGSQGNEGEVTLYITTEKVRDLVLVRVEPA